MELDQLLTLLSVVAGKVLPIAGVVVLVYLAIFVKRLIALMKSTNDAAIEAHKTLVTLNKDLEALDKPLKTINELSETVDCIHDASKNAVRYSLSALIENFSAIKDWIFARYEQGEDTVQEDVTDSPEKEGDQHA